MTLVDSSRQIQRTPLGTQVADALRRDILMGVVKPGTRMAQQQLCDQYGMSRMPVRDGLRVLLYEGLLTLDAGNHMVVAPLSREDLLDAFTIEGMLTGMAAERASRHATDADLDGMEDLHKRMTVAAKAHDQTDMADLNWSFHRSINRLAHSRKLLAALRTLSMDLPRNFLVQMPSWNEKSNQEHEAILEAMRADRHDKVKDLMTRHVVESGAGLIEYLESQGLVLE